MKTRHAGALVLVVWYLMYPPMNQKGMPSKDASLEKWGLLNSFGTANSCDAALSRMKEETKLPHPENSLEVVPDQVAIFVKCIASDDSRLKDK